MKAYVLHDIDKLQLEEVPKPALQPNEVLVEVRAAGICGSDIPRIYTTGTYSYPLIPGHEFAGTVAAVGERIDQAWMGARVGVFPLIPCRSCVPCQKGKFELCRNYSYLGSRTNGGFAEYVAVPEQNLIALPENVSFAAAAMLEPMAVAVHAFRQTAVKKDETAVVCGLGTIGIFLTMFLKEKGIGNVLTIGNKEFQKNIVQKLGVSSQQYCDSRTEDVSRWLMEQTDGQGADVFFECVGKNETIGQAVRNTAPEGRVQLVGNPASDISFEKNIYWKILRNQLTIKGSWNSSFTHGTDDDWHYVLERLGNGKIDTERFITHSFPFAELKKGLQIMHDKEEEYIKVMINKRE